MGVHGLWELLAPVGRRVSVETLAGKKLAIDASIWMVQFIKAMRDDRGEMVRNAHLLGFFRRICKLLFLRTKPVFVFDGATPALKRRTLIARRRQRENAQAKVRKTAEKLLLNHLKAIRLRELAENIKNQKQQKKQDVPKKNLPNHNKIVDGTSTSEWSKSDPNGGSHEKLDGMLAASILAEENGVFSSSASSFAGATLAKEDSGEQSILNQKYKNDSKCKKILSDEIHVVGSDSERMEVASRSAYQQNLDEMLAASIAAEEARSLDENVSVSTAANLDGEDTDDEDEEMILPEMHGVVDPSVLAALPPSVQLDLLVQMRERLMAENRQKYQRVKKDPAKFSELQIQAYLKTVAFRRDIDQVQKAAAGRGVGGVQTSRIASEANREFIFSSSFTGDKQVLASTTAEKNGDKDLQAPRVQQPLSSLNNTEIPSTSNALAQPTPDKSGVFEDNIETFLDERGRVRVSRVRAMGMHMTRDLERNLDLMKEIEKNTRANKAANPEPMQNIEICNPESFSFQSQVLDTSDEGVGESINKLNERGAESMLHEDTAIEILLEDEGGKSFDGGDDLFTHLAAENPIQMASFDISSQKLSLDGTTDSCWGKALEGKAFSPNFFEVDDNSFKEGTISDESEVDWEDGVCDHVNPVPFEAESGKSVSKGSLEEEADLQEAIRRSLEDVGDRKSGPISSEHQQLQPVTVGKMAEQCTSVQNENVIGLEKQDSVDGMNCSNAKDSIQFKGMTESSSQEKKCLEPVVLLDTTIAEQLDVSYKDAKFSHKESNENSDTLKPLSRDISGATQVGDRINNIVTEPPCMVEMEGIYTPDADSSPKASACENHFKQNLPVDKHSSDLLLEEEDTKIPAVEEISNAEIEVTEDELTNRISILEQERLNLGDEQKRLERNAESVSSEMFAECQELLQMFGLPYIIAPMEAEAQCAYMELANLVDGVVTDDSDVFLFGARSVYKNIFDDRKYVETYFMKDVENELGLNRDKLIRMALLLGSDYTEGISGIGIVNAVEVMNAFPEEDGLRKFKEWIASPDPSILGTLGAKTGLRARKRGSKASENDMTCSNSSVRDGSASEENIAKDLKENMDVKQIFMDKHRNVSKNWHIPSEFPSEGVISAYIGPQVDKSAEPFSWGKPDHFVLRRLCWEKFGWENSKADELLLPVLKEYSKHETQLRLEAFYTFNERFAKIRSKRIKKAVKSITGSRSAVLMDDTVRDVSANNQRELSVESQDNMSEKCSSDIHGARSNEDDIENSLRKPSRKRQVDGERSQPAKDRKLTMKEKGKRSRNEESHSERGRGRGKGRGRGRLASKGKTSITELAETSSSDDESEFDGGKFDLEDLQEPQERRKSLRIRKSASYTMDDADQPPDHSGDIFSNDEAKEDDVVRSQHACPETVVSPSENTECDFVTPKRSPQKDYLETGGGFCPVEDEISQEAMCRNKDPTLEASNNEDYLTMGGGFCGDDDNECIDPVAHPDQATALEVPKDGSEDYPGQSTFHPEKLLGGDQNKEDTDARGDSPLDGGDPNPVSNPNSSLVGESVQEEPDHSLRAFGGALSAMPNLRRKRRKY